MKLTVSYPTDHATSIRLGSPVHFANLQGLPSLGEVVKLEKDTDEVTVITIELADDEAELK